MRLRIVFFCIFVSLLLYVSSHADDAQPPLPVTPALSAAEHNVGNMRLCVQNSGVFGGSYYEVLYDCFTGKYIPYMCEFPKGSSIEYLYTGALWVGAIIGTDTLVSTATKSPRSDYLEYREFFPDPAPAGDMVYRSTAAAEPAYREGAVSEQDFIAVYTDTLLRISTDVMDGRLHEPLYLKVTQKSYAWSYGHAEDFVLFDMEIENIGENTLKDVYIGLYVYAMPGYAVGGVRWTDLCGLLKTAPSDQGCGFVDTLNLAWGADEDGDPYQGEFIDRVIWSGGRPYKSARSIAGTMFVKTPVKHPNMSYNWWSYLYALENDPGYDFGPRRKANFRDFKTGGLGGTRRGSQQILYDERRGD